MKNFIRICMLILAVGAVLGIGGAAAGGTLYSTIDSHGLHPWGWHFPRLRWETDEEYNERTGSGRGSGSVWDGTRKAPAALDRVGSALDRIDGTLDSIGNAIGDLDRITVLEKLDFELTAGDYMIVEGEDYGIECDGDWIESNIENGVWRIRTDSPHWPQLRNIDRSCTITIPAGCTVNELDWEIGAANVEVYASITTKKADFEVGAGNLDITGLTVTDKLDAEAGAGHIGLGLTGSWDDYHVKAGAAMGTVSINGDDLVAGFAGSASKGSGPRKLDVEVGMGAIDITTETA